MFYDRGLNTEKEEGKKSLRQRWSRLPREKAKTNHAIRLESRLQGSGARNRGVLVGFWEADCFIGLSIGCPESAAGDIERQSASSPSLPTMSRVTSQLFQNIEGSLDVPSGGSVCPIDLAYWINQIPLLMWIRNGCQHLVQTRTTTNIWPPVSYRRVIGATSKTARLLGTRKISGG